MTKEDVIEILERFVLGAKPCSQKEIVDACASAYRMLKEQLSLPSDLDEVAKKQAETIYPKIIRTGHVAEHDVNLLTRRGFKKGFKAGVEWLAGQFVLVGGEPTGWFRANDGSEYATGLDLKEPIKLPVDFYVRKK